MSRGPRLAELVVGVHTSARRPAQHPSRERPSPSCERSSAVAACSEPPWWSAEAVNSGQPNWECRSLSDRRISSSSSLPIWVSAWDGTIADHGAGSQVWVITRFRVITQTSADMHAGRTNPRTAGHYPSAAPGNQAPTDDSRWPCLSTDKGWGKESPRTGGGSVGVAEEWSPGCSDALQKQESLGK